MNRNHVTIPQTKLILMVMLLKIIPMFSGIYDRFKVPLPFPTRVLLATSHLLTDHLLVVGLMVIAAVVAGTNAARTEAGRMWIDRTKFNLPLFGPLQLPGRWIIR